MTRRMMSRGAIEWRRGIADGRRDAAEGRRPRALRYPRGDYADGYRRGYAGDDGQ